MQKADLGASCRVQQNSVANSSDNHKVINDVVTDEQVFFSIQIYTVVSRKKNNEGNICSYRTNLH